MLALKLAAVLAGKECRDDWKQSNELRSGKKREQGLSGEKDHGSPRLSSPLPLLPFLILSFKTRQIRRTEIQSYSGPTGIWLQNVLIMDVRLGDLIKFAGKVVKLLGDKQAFPFVDDSRHCRHDRTRLIYRLL